MRLFNDRNPVLRNTIALSFGFGVSQVIIFFIQLITRRLFAPEVFGAYDVYFNIFGILVVVAALRFEMAIMLPEDDADASNLIVLTFIFSLAFNILVFITVLFFRNSISHLLGFPEKYSGWFFFMPLTTFFFSAYQVINYWLLRKKKFMTTSVNKILRRSAEGTAQVSLGLFNNSFGLVIGDVFGNLLNFIMGAYQMARHNFSLKSVSIANLVSVFRRYIDFPKYNLIPGLLNTVSSALPFVIINKFYGVANTGYFGLSKMILAIPIALISTAVSQVLLQRVTEKRNSGDPIKSEINRIAFYLFCAGIAGALVLSLWGVEILTFLFDDRWKRSGEFIQIIVFGSAINFIVSPLSIIFVALEQLKKQALWQITYFLLILGLFLFKSFPIENFLYIYIGIDLLSYAIYFILIQKVLTQYEFSLAKID